MNNKILFLLIFLLVISCKNESIDISKEFIRANKTDFHSKCDQLYPRSRFIKSNNISDFLTRIWSYFDAPDYNDDDGFMYYIKHLENNDIIIPTCVSNNIFYLTNIKNADKAKRIINRFEWYLKQTKYIDCEIKMKNKAKIIRLGYKKGKLL